MDTDSLRKEFPFNGLHLAITLCYSRNSRANQMWAPGVGMHVCELVCLKYIDKGGGACNRKEHFRLMRHDVWLDERVSHVSATHIRPAYFISVMFISSHVYRKLSLHIDVVQPL